MKLKLTPLAKVLIGVLVVVLVGGGLYGFGLFDDLFDKTPNVTAGDQNSTTTPAADGVVFVDDGEDVPQRTSSERWRISLDEWIGWEPLLYANGGYVTTPDSANGQRGLNIEYVIINDGTQSSNALIKGDLDGAGYTINRVAYLMDKFESSNVGVVMPYISNYSNGGDGIIAKSDIKTVNDLIGKKVGIPRFSEAQTLVEWLLEKSDLSEAEIAQIEMVYFDSPDDVAKAFFGGSIDAGATWQPYLTQATETAGAHVLFSTKNATNLILDGILFREDFIKANEADVVKFIDAALSVMDGYGTNDDARYDAIRKAMPLFAMESTQDIVDMAATADLAGYADNVNLLDGLAKEIFVDMSIIWNNVSSKMIASNEISAPIVTHPNRTDIFDSSYIKQLESVYGGVISETKVIVTEEVKEAAQAADTQALLSYSAEINFEANSAVFLNPEEAMATLNEFIGIAQTVNGAVIRIEGNVADLGWGDDKGAAQILSEERAKTVAKYLSQNGIDPNRFIVIGNGVDKPRGDNATEEGAAQNRRTDIEFITIE